MYSSTPFHSDRHELFQVLKHQDFAKADEGHTALSPADHSHVKTLPYFRTMGYSVGTAYAHENTGDTIASVMIGGITTVLNGAFPLQTGDRVMWYLTKAEADMFDPAGRRILMKGNPSIPMKGNPMEQADAFSHGDVKDFVERVRKESKRLKNDTKSQSRNKVQFMKNVNGFELAGNEAKSEVALIKPFHYRFSSDGDIERVFAVCISPAAPFEMVDIMISRQSM